MAKYINFIIIGLVVVILTAYGTFFTVDQRKFAVVFQFGEAVKVINEPGLNVRMPLVQNVEYFDKRILNIDVEAKEVTASDEKRLIVDAFAKFKIVDPVKFYRTVYNISGLNIRLNKIVESSMRKVIGKVPLTALISDQRYDVMQKIYNMVNETSLDYGINVVDVRILRTDLPKENSNAIYSRMQTEREKEARQIRAEGEEAANIIKATADKESQIIIANAYKDAQIMKGEGDQKSSQIYSKAYSRDADFYKFYRSLKAYKNSLDKSDTSYILSPNSEFMKYLHINK